MNQAQIGAMHRKLELENRARRRLILMAQVKNEAALLNEELDEVGRLAHETALDMIRQQTLDMMTDSEPGYWRRLWWAICGGRRWP